MARRKRDPNAPPRPKPLSRADRWSAAVGQAKEGLEALLELQGEYESWKGNLPESLESSPVGQKLETVCDIDLQGSLDTLEEAESADLPLGFGRD
jgi:hypothetical protein